MSENREPPGDEVMLDADGFAVLIQVVSSGSEQMAAIDVANPTPSPHAPEAFGDLGAAWSEFHQAWNLETVSSAGGLATFADQMQRTAEDFHRADEHGGAAINGSPSQTG